ncbi:hypothetical protein Q7P37_010546 [Cladosporium fusiforme]
MDTTAPPCPFLGLPVELRLQIYSHTLLDSPTITISTAKLTGAHSDIVHRLYEDGRSPFPGIPLNSEPVIEEDYDESLLSVTTPPTIPLPQYADAQPRRDRHYPSCPPLLLANKQIHGELKSHFDLKHRHTASVFISYPHGLHVFHTLAPSLIRQARSIHLAGEYKPTTFSPTHRAYLLSQHQPSIPPEHNYNSAEIPDSPTQLADLIKSLFGPRARHTVDKLELRVYFPGEDSYSTVWGDDCSPVVLALRNIFTGEINITVYRGRYGTGVSLTASAHAEQRRVVSTVWRRLEEGRRGEPVCGSWVVNSKWPAWEAEDDSREGDTVLTSAPRGDA